jgi:hypothetical protein
VAFYLLNGSLVSPFVALFNPMTTLVIYGVCLLVSAVISSFIFPDTTKTKMPETLIESKKMPHLNFLISLGMNKKLLTQDKDAGDIGRE